jgi:aspartyl-tRNA(Asn)/glutamyl-tRNA(Gln) amidotransferase subunit B
MKKDAMEIPYQAVIGLEVHAELQTRSKMFCDCPVVDSTQAAPNTAVCEVCAAMPGVLPVLNRQAVDYGLRVALALECEVAPVSLFARKNYFYPDLPKGYQISQYEYPLAQHGRLRIHTEQGGHLVRIRRVHLEEDTGKLTHVQVEEESYSLVDLNRAGLPLLEIVSEPDMHSLDEVRAYAMQLRDILRYLGVNSGDMSKGVMRFEANVSMRRSGDEELGTRVEIKNLNSFRSMERAIAYEMQRQEDLLRQGLAVRQETLGWDDIAGKTFSQRGKEEAHDYRYFPEPDLPPLEVDQGWVEQVRAGLPELPQAKIERFVRRYSLSRSEAQQLSDEISLADYFEACVHVSEDIPPTTIANWITGPLFAWMNETGVTIEELTLAPQDLIALLDYVQRDVINLNTAHDVLQHMLGEGSTAEEVIKAEGLEQIHDREVILSLVSAILAKHPREAASYREGKTTLINWFFGQVMRASQGRANPQVVREELIRQLGDPDKSG